MYVIVCDVEVVGFAVGDARLIVGAAGGTLSVVHVTEPAALTLPELSVWVTEYVCDPLASPFRLIGLPVQMV